MTEVRYYVLFDEFNASNCGANLGSNCVLDMAHVVHEFLGSADTHHNAMYTFTLERRYTANGSRQHVA